MWSRAFLVSVVGHVVLIAGLTLFSGVHWPLRGGVDRPYTIYQVGLLTEAPEIPQPGGEEVAPGVAEAEAVEPEPTAPQEGVKAIEAVPEPSKEPPPSQPAKEVRKPREVKPRGPVPAQEKPTGEVKGKAGQGLTTLKVEGEPFPFPDYLSRIHTRISIAWRSPVMPGKEALLTTISFRILSDGRVVDVRVAESSGDPIYDHGALRAVTNSNPMPPLPLGYRGDFLKVFFDFELPGRR